MMHQLTSEEPIKERDLYTPWDILIQDNEDGAHGFAAAVFDNDLYTDEIVTLLWHKVRGATETEIVNHIKDYGGHINRMHVRRMLIRADLYEIDLAEWNLGEIEHINYKAILRDVQLVHGHLIRYRENDEWVYKKPKNTSAQGYDRFCLLMRTIRGRFGLPDDPLQILQHWRRLMHEPLGEVSYGYGQGQWHQQVFAVQYRWGLSYTEAKRQLREIQNRGRKQRNPRQDAQPCSD